MARCTYWEGLLNGPFKGSTVKFKFVLGEFNLFWEKEELDSQFDLGALSFLLFLLQRVPGNKGTCTNIKA